MASALAVQVLRKWAWAATLAGFSRSFLLAGFGAIRIWLFQANPTAGNYALVENLVPLFGDVWLTVGGHYSWGHVDIRRGYLNAGSADFSSGKPDQNGWGLRARLDWENAFAVEKVAFAPFVDLSRTQAHLDYYQETGGGFRRSR